MTSDTPDTTQPEAGPSACSIDVFAEPMIVGAWVLETQTAFAAHVPVADRRIDDAVAQLEDLVQRVAQLVDAAADEERLLDKHAVAELLGDSVRTIERKNEAQKLPRPVTTEGALKWRLSDIRRWIAAGCPSAEDFELLDRPNGRLSTARKPAVVR